MKLVRFGSMCALGAVLTFAIGLPAAHGSVTLIQVGVDSPDDPGLSSTPVLLADPDLVPVMMDGTAEITNTLPAIPEAIEYGRLVRARSEVGSVDSSLFGESVDYYTGETDFAATDVDLPGNNALRVALGRRYHVTNHAGGAFLGAFGDWDLDLPHVEGIVAKDVGWTVPVQQVDARCSYFGAPPPATVTTPVSGGGNVTTSIPAKEYNLGFTAFIPGLGRHELLLRESAAPAPSGPHPVTTKDLWAVSCVERNSTPIPGAPDEGFAITTPDGITYTFRQGWVRPYSPLTRPADTATAGVSATVDRQLISMLPTRVQDRFGNAVVYTYQYDGIAGIALKTIEATDGRRLSLTYMNGVVDSVTDGRRTWSYRYDGSHRTLQQVMRPDGSSWSFDFGNLNTAQWTYASQTCNNLPTPPSVSFSGTIRHPSGASGTFTFTPTRHGRSGVPNGCLTNSANASFAPVEPPVYDVLSLTKKQVTGPYISTQTWAVSYSGCSSSSCNSTKTTTVTDPRNFTTVYTFGSQYGTNGNGNEGMLLRKQSGSGQRDEKYDYYNASGNPYPAVIGTPAQVRGDVSALSSLRPVQKRTLSIDGATYTRTMSSPDVYGFSRTITRTGSDTKTETITYSHNTNDWVLGTIVHVVSDGRTEVDLTLNSHNQPTQVRHFDHTDQKLDYYNDGPVRWITDGNGNTTSYRDYKLGVPRSMTYADGSTESAVISDLGLITSHTDAAGLTTGYGYDNMGWLSTITPPGGYNATTITWNPSTSGWTRKQVTGNATTTDEYDAFLHPRKTTDSTGRFIYHEYDSEGRRTFESYPSNNTYGIRSSYDGVGRLISEVDDQGRAINYTWGANTLSINDRNGHSTNYSYRTYDEPDTAWVTAINRPDIGWTNVGRDTWGKPTSTNRGGTRRTYQYYGNQWLKSVTEPETGVTTFTYDDAGNVTSVNYDGAATETRTYDKRNRLKTISYSDGSPGVAFNWRGDGQPDNASRGSVKRSYAYDGGGLATGETLTINGSAYSLGYAYDGNRHLKALTYPDNATINFSPDAFGRPGGAGSFATNASYFPNDALQGFTYGNGIVHSLTQYTNGRPHVAQDAGVLNVTYGYDYKGNPTSISDSLNAPNSRTLTYDGTDRLKTATGPWGTATFAYDVLDNLTGDTATGFSATLDANNRLAGATWDSRGRMTQKGSGAGTVKTTFDAANLLTAVSRGPNRWSYSYDALGYRATAAGGGANTVSVYDRAGRLMYEAATDAPAADVIFQNGFEVSAAPVTTTKYVYLGSHLVAKAIKNGAATQTVYVHTDALGSPVAQTDATRALVGTTTYLPYGGRYGSAGMGGDPGPGYANHYDDATGLIYMRARYYDPALHRFISTDPTGVDTATGINFNRYAYALNSPFGYIDPDGRDPCETDCAERLKAADEQVAKDARTLVGLAFAPLAGIADLVKGVATGDSKLAGEGAANAVMDLAIPEVEVVKTATSTVKAATGVGEAVNATKRSFSAADRAQGFERSKDAAGTPRCGYCGEELSPKAGSPNSYEADHTIPYARGGPSTQENLTPSCRTCNRSKGAKTPKNGRRSWNSYGARNPRIRLLAYI